MKQSLRFSGLLLGTCVSLPALAQTQTSPTDKEDAKQTISLGLAPGTPQIGALPGGLTPAYGLKAADEKDWRFDFHGFLTMPVRAGLNTRSGPDTPDQHKETLHAPPVVPDDRDSFSYTGVVPNPRTVSIMAAFSLATAATGSTPGSLTVLGRKSTTIAGAPPARVGMGVVARASSISML